MVGRENNGDEFLFQTKLNRCMVAAFNQYVEFNDNAFNLNQILKLSEKVHTSQK
jgi:hypothetical protein